ncbi:MAG: hypothetical protein ACOYOO_15545, partial [Saprospiraceae bacterium]
VVNEKTFSKANCVSTQKITITATDLCAAREIQTEPSTPGGTSGVAIERVILVPQGGSPINIVTGADAGGVNLGDVVTTNRLDGDNKGTNSWVYNGTNLPDGTHELRVVVRDDCGNLSKQSSTYFTVGDDVGTAPICIAGLSTALASNPGGKDEAAGMAVVWATDCIAGPTYDCNGQGPETDATGKKLIRKYYIVKDNGDGVWNAADSLDARGYPIRKRTSVMFDCNDADYTFVRIRIYSEDERGNMAYCDGYVIVTDPGDVCGKNAASAQVSGGITTESGIGVEGVEVNLSGKTTMLYMSDNKGKYSFGGLEMGNDYTVTPHLDKDPMNGVSTYDLAMITRHVLSQQLLDSPYKIIAADINNSRSVTTLDLIQLRKLILGIEAGFVSNTSWRFIDAAFKFPNPQNPWQTPFPEIVNVNDLDGDITASFIAVKVGDVTGNVAASGGLRAAGHLSVRTEDQSISSGAVARIPVYSDFDGIEGIQFTLNFDRDAIELVEIEHGIAGAENIGMFPEQGALTASWNAGSIQTTEGQPFFTIVLKAKRDISSLEGMLNIDSRLTAAEAYRGNGELLVPRLDIEKAAALGFALKQNVPNPFFGETIIGFMLPVSGEVTLSLTDVQGRTVKVVKGTFDAGYQEIKVKGADLPAGVLQYTLSSGSFSATRRMIVTK